MSGKKNKKPSRKKTRPVVQDPEKISKDQSDTHSTTVPKVLKQNKNSRKKDRNKITKGNEKGNEKHNTNESSSPIRVLCITTGEPYICGGGQTEVTGILSTTTT